MAADVRVTVAAGPPIDAAFEQLYPDLRAFAAAIADRDIDPDDLVQDALAGFLRTASDVLNLGAYLRTAIVHAAGHERTRRGRQREAHRQLQAIPAIDTGAQYPSHVAALLTGVAPIDRALLYLVHVDGHSVNDAASAVGLTAVAARARMSRARRYLRRQLKEATDA